MKKILVIFAIIFACSVAYGRKISEYPVKNSPSGNDSVLVIDSADPENNKIVTLASILNLGESGGYIATWPSWMPSSAPSDQNQIIQATGGCSNTAYGSEANCTANGGTWTPLVGVWTSVIKGLIDDTGTSDDVLLSASKVISLVSTKQNLPVTAPTTSSSTCSAGSWAYDSSWLYVCISENTWGRAQLGSW